MRRPVLLVAVLIAGCAEQPAPPAGDPWSEIPLPDLWPGPPRRRLEPAVTALGTELVIAGGFSTSQDEGLEITDEVLVLDTLTGAWRALPPTPVRWTHAALAAVGATLYLLGGLEDVAGTASGQAFVLPPGADAWQELPAMPTPRGAAAVLVAPPLIYLIGGIDGTTPFASVLAFDTIDRTWLVDPLPPLPLARSHAAAMRQADGTIIVAGGLDDALRPLGDVWRLHPTADGLAWEPAEPMPVRRGGCAYGTAFGALVCAGGEAGSVALDVAERYDPAGLVIDDEAVDVWSELPPMPEARAGARGATIGGKLFVVGGSRSLAFEPTGSILVLSFVDTIDQPGLGSN